MVSFHCVHHLPFCGDVKSVHDSINGSYGLMAIKEVLRKFGSVVGVCKVANIFAKSDGKGFPVCPMYAYFAFRTAAGLSDVCFFCNQDKSVCILHISSSLRVCILHNPKGISHKVPTS
jgi:hypothetical protein